MNHQTPNRSNNRHDRQAVASAQAIELLKRAYPIQDVLARYGIALPGASLHRMARCPFHADTHPSMGVFLDTNRFFCFRCGAKGDVLDLIQRLDGIPFREAVARLGDQAPESPPKPEQRRAPLRTAQPTQHVASSPVDLDATERDQSREGREDGVAVQWHNVFHRLVERGTGAAASSNGSGTGSGDADTSLTTTILTTAAALYQEHLLRTPHALAYLKARGIPLAVARRARLGYADATTLQAFVGQDAVVEAVARQVGLLDAAGRDRMRGRLVIPEFRAGRCVWMVGRLIPSTSTATPTQAYAQTGTLSPHARATGGLAHDGRPKYLGVSLPKPLLGVGLVTPSRHEPCDHAAESHLNSMPPCDRHDGYRSRGVLVVEGPFDLLTALVWRVPALCVALVGTYANARQAAELIALANGGPIWLALDSDAAGDVGVTRLQTQLALAGCGAQIRRLPIPDHAKDLSEIVASLGARHTVIRVLTNAGTGGAMKGGY